MCVYISIYINIYICMYMYIRMYVCRYIYTCVCGLVCGLAVGVLQRCFSKMQPLFCCHMGLTDVSYMNLLHGSRSISLCVCVCVCVCNFLSALCLAPSRTQMTCGQFLWECKPWQLDRILATNHLSFKLCIQTLASRRVAEVSS